MPLINVHGVDINYERAGHGSAVVFCHGYTGSHHDWENQVPTLVEAGYQIVAIDSRGHGNSAAPPLPSDYSIPIFARDTYEVVHQLGISEYCLVGHSMGGFTALELALGHPWVIKTLVLVDTSAQRQQRPPGYEELRAKLDELAKTKGLEAAFEYNATHFEPMRQRFAQHPELREQAKERTLRTSVNGYIYSSHALSQWGGVSSRLGEITFPTLILAGEEDLPYLEISNKLKTAIRGSRLVTFPGAGHSPHEEQPEAFNQALLDFLREIMPPGPHKHNQAV